MESARDGVFAIQDGTRQSLPAPGEAILAQGDGIDVDATGRALVHFEDLLTVEVLRDGELTLQELSADEQSAFVTVAQQGGVLINDFSASELVERRFTVETEFATITATGTQFVVAYEENGEEIWVFAQVATDNDLQVEAAGATQTVTSGMASSVREGEAPSDPTPYDAEQLDSWLNQLRDTGEVDTDIAVVVDTDIAGVVLGAPEVLLQTRDTLDPEEDSEQVYELNVPAGSVVTMDVSTNGGTEGHRTWFSLEQEDQKIAGTSIRNGEGATEYSILSYDQGGAYEFVARKSFGTNSTYVVTITSQLQMDGGQRGDARETMETATMIDIDTSNAYRGTMGRRIDARDRYDAYRFSAETDTVATIEVVVRNMFGGRTGGVVFWQLYHDDIKIESGGATSRTSDKKTITLLEGREYLLLFEHGSQIIDYEFSIRAQEE